MGIIFCWLNLFCCIWIKVISTEVATDMAVTDAMDVQQTAANGNMEYEETVTPVMDYDYSLPPDLPGLPWDMGNGNNNVTLDPDDVNVTGLTEQECAWKLLTTFPDIEHEYLSCRCMGLFCPNLTEAEREEQLISIKKKLDTINSGDDIYIAVSYSLVMLIGTVGNILVLVTVIKVFKAPSVTNMFICSLAVADLAVVLLCIPFRITDYVGEQVWYLGEEMCKTYIYVYYASFMCSVFTLTAMSLERYLVICHPMKAAAMSTPGRARKIIAVAWIAAFALAVPCALMAGVRNLECDNYSLDNYKWSGYYFFYLFFAIFLIPSILMGFAYGRTAVVLWKSISAAKSLTGKTGKDGNSDSAKKSNEAKARLQVIRMLALVWLLFTLTWGSYLCFHILNIYRIEIKLITSGYNLTVTNQVLNILTMANSAVNPILYAFLSSQFRKGFIKCFSCIPCVKRKYMKSSAATTAHSNITSSSNVSTSGVYSISTSTKT